MLKRVVKGLINIKYKKGSEMAADFLSLIAVDVVGILDNNWKMAQNQDDYCEIVKQHMSKKNNCQFKQLDVAISFFI